MCDHEALWVVETAIEHHIFCLSEVVLSSREAHIFYFKSMAVMAAIFFYGSILVAHYIYFDTPALALRLPKKLLQII